VVTAVPRIPTDVDPLDLRRVLPAILAAGPDVLLHDREPAPPTIAPVIFRPGMTAPTDMVVRFDGSESSTGG